MYKSPKNCEDISCSRPQLFRTNLTPGQKESQNLRFGKIIKRKYNLICSWMCATQDWIQTSRSVLSRAGWSDLTSPEWEIHFYEYISLISFNLPRVAGNEQSQHQKLTVCSLNGHVFYSYFLFYIIIVPQTENAIIKRLHRKLNVSIYKCYSERQLYFIMLSY